jgi:flagellar biosynthetic protein FliR
MPVDLTFSAGTLYAFLLVLARVSGALVFVPLPGFRGAVEPARAALALAFTMALATRWPVVDAAAEPGTLLVWIAGEAAIGITIGVSLSIALECFSLAAQVLGTQAGYAYASTIDPNSDADSGVLLVVAQLMAGMLFFALGLDRELLRLFARTLDRIPAGAYVPGTASAESMIRLGGMLFTFGVRLALPVVALLLLVDVALALLGRLNQQLQLLSLAFPIKMLLALLVLGWTASMYPRILLDFTGRTLGTAARMLALSRHGRPQRKDRGTNSTTAGKGPQRGPIRPSQGVRRGAAVPGFPRPDRRRRRDVDRDPPPDHSGHLHPGLRRRLRDHRANEPRLECLRALDPPADRGRNGHNHRDARLPFGHDPLRFQLVQAHARRQTLQPHLEARRPASE